MKELGGCGLAPCASTMTHNFELNFHKHIPNICCYANEIILLLYIVISIKLLVQYICVNAVGLCFSETKKKST
jgi:hypothetical protein